MIANLPLNLGKDKSPQIHWKYPLYTLPPTNNVDIPKPIALKNSVLETQIRIFLKMGTSTKTEQKYSKPHE